MGSITRYYCHIKNNHCRIDFECEGDYGDCDDGIELEFELDTYLQQNFPILKDGNRISWDMLVELKRFVYYKQFLESMK